MSNTDYYSLLRIRAFTDLTNRAKPGILIYAVVWFAIAFTLDLNTKNELFFTINSVLLIAFVVVRSLHLKLHHNVNPENVATLEGWLTAGVLIGALHWGLMSAWVFYDASLDELESAILIVLAAFAMGGTSTLSISRTIRLFYPALLFLPSITVFLWQGAENDYLYAGLIITSWIYIYFASLSAEFDYWQAVSNSLIAEARAEELEKLSSTDPLTQIANRMFFDTEYDKEWQRGIRLKSCLSILMIDLDYFKQINDKYGHPFGDECLKKVAATLDHIILRPGDCLARYGGEEFIVMLPNTDEAGAVIVAQRIVQAVREINLSINEEAVPIRCSVGVASLRPSAETKASTLIKNSDNALYQAKKLGRDRYEISQATD